MGCSVFGRPSEIDGKASLEAKSFFMRRASCDAGLGLSLSRDGEGDKDGEGKGLPTRGKDPVAVDAREEA